MAETARESDNAPQPALTAERRAFTPFDFALYAASVLAWGLSWIAMHYQVATVAPAVSVVWRFAIATPSVLAIAALRGEPLRFSLADHRYFLGLGVAIFSTNFLLFYYAAQHVVSGLLSIVFSLASIGKLRSAHSSSAPVSIAKW